jgi:23S rRNA-/tRNA-specific pseudouridylate synthase
MYGLIFPAVLKRISEDEELSPGSVLVIHSKAMEPKPAKKTVQVTKEKAAKEKFKKLSVTEKTLSKGTPDIVRPEVQDLRDRVLFRDDHVIVLNKAQGLAVQVRLMLGSGLCVGSLEWLT